MTFTLILGRGEPDRPDYSDIFRDEHGERPCWRCPLCKGEAHHWTTESAGYADNEPNHPGALSGLVLWLECRHCPAWRAVRDADLIDDFEPAGGAQ